MTEIIAGPCSFETFEDTEATVKFLTGLGIKYIRGGALKYRSIPKDYQGSYIVYEWITKLKKDYDFKFVNEIYDMNEMVNSANYSTDLKNIDVVQVGSRNMFNTKLLKDINYYSGDHKGTVMKDKQVILKRHFASSLNSFIDHAGYLEDSEVILCLRGIMGLWPQEQRFMPDVTDIARLRKIMTERQLFDTHSDPLKAKDIKYKYKICYDVSHSACHSDYVKDLVKCAMVYDPDYLMIEVHSNLKNALSDKQQQISNETFKQWFDEGIFNA